MLALAQLTVLFQAHPGWWPFAQADLHLGVGGPAPLAYGFFFGGLLLFGGQLADRVGARRTLVAGLVGFALASLLGGASTAAGMLAVARALQGVFAALVTPSALALVNTAFSDPKERRRAFGIYASVGVGGAACAVLPNTWLAEATDWRLCLFAAAPVATVALVGVLTLVHDAPRRAGARFDALGALLGFASVAALTFGHYHAEEQDAWTAPLAVIPLAGGALALVTFLWWQTRTSSPLIPPYVLRDRGRIGCYLTMILSGVGTFGLFGILNFYLLALRDYAPTAAGMNFLLLFIALVLGATQVSARLLHRVAPRVLVVAGLLTTALGLVLMIATESVDGHAPDLVGMLVIGFGLGTAFMPLYALAADAVAPEHSGAASAALTVTQYLGGTIGSVLLVTVDSPRMLWGATAAVLLAAVLAAPLISAGTRPTRTAGSGPTRPA
ncbi:hypothetical protein AQI95_26215 [Streptomyces yokosukanensis]|uniref:Major facilitator superfamily (MFS) profile domain-containing protein n=1 Tax=Streptomyces yokosukanensis TaxID=67386 RepID=A0A101NZT4_9ACTN|nr:MFS transporter [Streptomyces yokosukanensis]KUN02329.1 hypothetical protein AQI95_26215 [Streptomyces yokosukanensis]